MKLKNATAQFQTHTYPATTDELIEAYGETELTLPNGTETLGEALGRLESETFESANAAHMAVYSAVSSKGIGRKYYSDRDPIAPGEEGPDPLSL
ncbi:DUF5789 family protein [Halapricum hydrolyticum]|uniref:DUF2795 domain-containing protein n=1 Tax=Halapricum hydrolyticum TaxID=2979991 RepID=A0AAE3LFJ0_9EURY|nr:DUF2795 domain-containing protein [Halapricum hydrolyticum]MCU4718647.1 DUF2795 domain-containing protein [Halapricum hydrolyticum]MCU4727667.1 DUF2795 domain-containing protein [Halapricum hydrolyticum]